MGNKTNQSKNTGESTHPTAASPVKRGAATKKASSAGAPKPEERTPTEPPSSEFVVRGRILDATGAPCAGVEVVAFDCNLRNEAQLGKATTDALGHYTIPYSAKQFRLAGKSRADLVVRALDETGAYLGQSALLCNAPMDATIDVTIQRPETRLSEYEQLMAALTPRLNGLALAELNAEDIAFLAKTTGQDAERISTMQQSVRCAQALVENGHEPLPESIIYAWFRKGILKTTPDLHAQRADTLREALTGALAEHLIAPLSPTEEARMHAVSAAGAAESVTLREGAVAKDGDWIHAVLAVVQHQRVNGQLRSSSGTGTPTVADLFGASQTPTAETRASGKTVETARLSQDKQRILAEQLAGEIGLGTKLWENLTAHGFEQRDIGLVKQAYDLAALTKNHLPLVRTLQTMDEPTLAQPSGSLQYLARLNEDDWQDIITRTGVPDSIQGEGDDERRSMYAAMLERDVEKAFPTTTLAARIKQDRFAVPEAVKPDVMAFFDANPDFTFGREYVGGYLRHGGIARLEGVRDVTQLKNQLSKMERVVKLTDGYRQHSAVLDAGFDSANKIVRQGKRSFVDQVSAHPHVGNTAAEEIFARAAQTSSMALALLMRYRNSGSNLALFPEATLDTTELDRNALDAMKNLPDLGTLFGSLDTCACDPSLSVYSPAAYFVDILQYLKDRKISTDNSSALDELIKRRPELKHLELSASNTNTLVPYVDLVLEILENAVAPFQMQLLEFDAAQVDTIIQDLKMKKVSGVLRDAILLKGIPLSKNTVVEEFPASIMGVFWVIKDSGLDVYIWESQSILSLYYKVLNTSFSTQEAAAAPEHVNIAAYDALRKAVYPWNLPLELWNEEARTYLAHLGVPRHELMRIFYTGPLWVFPSYGLPDAGYTSAAPERLGISPAELDIISGDRTGAQPKSDQNPDPNSGPWNFWGFAASKLSASNTIPDPADSTKRITSGDWISVLTGRIDVFLQQSGLSYDELRELLDMRYVNMTLKGERILDFELGTMELGDAKTVVVCDLSKAKLTPRNSSFTSTDIEGVLTRMHRFVRLWRKLGWSMMDVDRAARPFMGERFPYLSFNQYLIASFEERRKWLKRYRIPTYQHGGVISTVQYIDYRAAGEPRLKSFYDELFLNKGVMDPPDPAFLLTDDREEVQDTTKKLSDHLGTLAAAFGLGTEDTKTLVGHATDDQLTRRNLSTAYFVALCAKWLAVSIKQFIALRSLRQGYSLYGDFYYPPPPSPAVPDHSDEHAHELGLKFKTTVAGYITGIGFWKAKSEKGNHIGHIWSETGQELARVEFRNETPWGKQQQLLVEPLRIKADTVYVVSVNANTHYGYTKNGLNTPPWQLGTLVIVSDGHNGVQGPAGKFPATPGTGDNYFCDVVFSHFPQERTSILALVDVLRAQAVTAAEAIYLCAHDVPADSGLAPVEDKINQVIDDIRKALRTIAQENRPKPGFEDLTGEGLREELRRLSWAPAVIDEIIDVLAEKKTYSVHLTQWPTGAVIPDALKAYVTYDTSTSSLTATRILTSEDKRLLETVSRDLTYVEAVDKLFRLTRASINRHLRTYEVIDFAVTLESLPSGVVFPEKLAPRVYYDTSSKKLHVLGTLSDLEYGKLQQLSTDTLYQQALDTLRASDSLVPASAQVLIGTEDVATLVEQEQKATTAGERFNYLIDKVMAYRGRALSKGAVLQKLGTALGFDTTTLDRLLGDWVLSARMDSQRTKAIEDFLDPALVETRPEISATSVRFPYASRSYIRLHKIALLAAKFSLTLEEFGWLCAPDAKSKGWLDLNDLPTGADESPVSLKGLLRLMALIDLRDRLPGGAKALSDIFAHADDAQLSDEDLLQCVSGLTGWSLGDLQSLTGTDGYKLTGDSLKAALKHEILLTRLCDGFAVIKRLGATAEQCLRWGKPEVDASAAREIKQLARARHTPASWAEVAKPLRDVLRDRQRQSLVSHLIVQQQLRDSNDLYNKYLIDVEMGPCAMTSRIKQACATVQLFVQRCLLNLEPEVPPSVIDTGLWSWMKNYRVWEANRKVFLYPENWLEPELRDDKTPFFAELESQLKQTDINNEKTEKAILTYINHLDQVAQLEMMAVCQENDRVDQQNIVHVFARTFSHPYTYFYRRHYGRGLTGHWSAWEKVDLGIEGNHLVAAVWNETLFLIWLKFMEKAEEPETLVSGQKPDKYWSISLSFAEYKDGKWAGAKQVPEQIKYGKTTFASSQCFLGSIVRPEGLTIVIGVPFLLNFKIGTKDVFRLKWHAIQVANRQNGPIRINLYKWTNEFQPITNYLEPYSRMGLEIGVQNSIVSENIFREKAVDNLKFPRTHAAGWIGLPLSINPQGSTNFQQGEFGIKFNCPRLGEILAIRFWKNQYETGPHIGRIWSESGELLAAVEFTSETESGWQEQTLLYPLSANLHGGERIRYVVSVNVNSHSTYIENGLDDVKPDWLPFPDANGGASGNIGTFPSSMSNTNYLVDIVFNVRDTFKLRYQKTENRNDIFMKREEILRPTTDYNANLFRVVCTQGAKNTIMEAPELSSETKTWVSQLCATFVAQDPSFYQDKYRTYYFEPITVKTGSSTNNTKAGLLFSTHYHPYVPQLRERLSTRGLPGMLSISDNLALTDGVAVDDAPDLSPEPGKTVTEVWGYPANQYPQTFYKRYRPYLYYVYPFDQPREIIEFHPRGAYSVYNWELFFHATFLAATHLSKQQRFSDALKWFHYIFNPTATPDSGVEHGKWAWQSLPLYLANLQTPIEELMVLLADRNNTSAEAVAVRDELKIQVELWRRSPFNPHAIARWRPRTYGLAVVMKYLDNLIAWGDQLFRQDTIEAINEATQLYILAAEILGPRPRKVTSNIKAGAKTYWQLSQMGLDEFSNVLVQAEAVVPAPAGTLNLVTPPPPLYTLYFCIPPNEKLMSYWDKVADRLFKVRHCMNIEGVERQLPLYEPPIDPGMLVKAAAAGIDIGTALSDATAPAPIYRFNLLSQKSTELCGEIRALGSALLSALEKRDAEALALLRSQHEINLLNSVRTVKASQVQEAKAALEGVGVSIESARERFNHYTKLLSSIESIEIPSKDQRTQLGRMVDSLVDLASSVNPGVTESLKEVSKLALEVATTVTPLMEETLALLQNAFATPGSAGPAENVALPLSSYEKRQLDELKISNESQLRAMDAEALSQILALIPDFQLGIQGLASSPVVQASFGGTQLSLAARLRANSLNHDANEHAYRANLHSIIAGHQRRAGEWLLQAGQALKEMEQLGKQAVAASIRLAVANMELSNHNQQIDNARDIDSYMRDKYTNEELYDWMVGQISGLYFQSYQLAFDVAKRAEKAFRVELGLEDKDSNFVQFGYWDSLKKGLLAGELLAHDIKRMEAAYLDKNKRELELTKHVSLRQLNPTALLELKTNGTCQVTIPEWLYDLDCPGHYMRRIKNVALSIPSVVGPYTSINCTLSLLKSSLRKSPLLKNDKYAREGSEDDRFVDSLGAVQSIVTSSGQNDSGLFETNLRDERFLPFEGAGAESTWKLDLPKDYHAFDYATIADVILHIRYTARQGVDATKVKAALDTLFGQANQAGLALVLSLRHDFPTEWSAFVNDKTQPPAPFTATIRKDFFPYFAQRKLAKGKKISISGLELYDGLTLNHRPADKPATPVELSNDSPQFTLSASVDDVVLPHKADAQVFLIIHYSLSS